MANIDYYKTLGVKRNANDADIKKQYRRLARKYHPDVSKLSNAEARFKEINEAYDVLKDQEKRSNYDRFGSADGSHFGSDGFTPPPNGTSNFGGFGQSNFNDIFDNMFKNVRGGQFNEGSFSQQNAQQSHQQNRPAKGENQTIKISVSLEDAYHGARRTINIRIPGESSNKKLKIKIPKGIKAGQKIRLSGQGSSGTHKKGDLLLEVSFAKHKHFTIDEKDISIVLPITPWEAALGTTLSIPTLGGIVGMKLPENTPGGKKLRLKGRGLPGKDAGDQYVILQIMTPEASSDELKELYKEMQKISQFNPRDIFSVN